jgi:methyl-accepting chemotaxis protein
MDDVEDQVRSAALKQIGLCVGALAVIAGLGIGIARSVLKQLGGEPALAKSVIDELAQGNLSVEVPASDAGSVIDGLRRMVESMRTIIEQVRTTKDNVNTASVRIASGNTDLSARTEQTSSNLQMAASSLEQLTGTVQQSAGSAKLANQLAASAAAVA